MGGFVDVVLLLKLMYRIRNPGGSNGLLTAVVLGGVVQAGRRAPVALGCVTAPYTPFTLTWFAPIESAGKSMIRPGRPASGVGFKNPDTLWLFESFA